MPETVLEVREYTPARLRSLTPYLATHDPAAAIEWYIEVFGAAAARRSDRDARRPHRPRRAAHRRHACSCSRASSPRRITAARSTLGGSTVAHPGVRARLRRDVRARGRAGRDAAAPDRRELRRARRRDPRSVRPPLVRADPDRDRRRSGGGRARPALRRHRLRDAAGSRRANAPAASTARSSAGRCTAAPRGSTSRRSLPRPASRTASKTPRRASSSASTTSRPSRNAIRDLGGEVLSVANYDSGGNAECRDDQGLRFDLFRPRAGY